VLPNLRIADREFSAQLQIARGIIHRRVVECPEDDSLCVIAASDAHLHPFAEHSGVARKLNLDAITAFLGGQILDSSDCGSL
jgi:hypothetical protein